MLDDDPRTALEDLVDVFNVSLRPPELVAGANQTTPQEFSGTFGIAFIELSFELECLPGFFGELCLNSTAICDPSPCDNGGVCEPDEVDGFTCTCVGDFTGRSCDVTIDDCLNVNCNNGTCVDGVGTFTCECEAGYTGQFCEELLQIFTNLITNDPTLSSDANSISATVVAGAVAGSFVFVLLVIIAVVLLSLLLARWRANNSPKGI